MPRSLTESIPRSQSQVQRENTAEFSLYVVMQLEKQTEEEKIILLCVF